MANLTKLDEAIAALSAKVDALNSKPVTDDQPAIDQAAAAVEAIAAKIPA